jgi:hypothetical protein
VWAALGTRSSNLGRVGPDQFVQALLRTIRGHLPGSGKSGGLR